MNIKVFGQLKDIINDENILIDDVNDMQDLKKYLYKLFPALKEKEFVVAVNKKIIYENISLQPDAEIALLPQFSGG